jgi:hypothetical protein
MYFTGLTYGSLESKTTRKKIPSRDKKSEKKNLLKDFFDVKHIQETFKVAFKDGPRDRKKRICVIMFLVMVIIGPLHGEMNVQYLFVRYKIRLERDRLQLVLDLPLRAPLHRYRFLVDVLHQVPQSRRRRLGHDIQHQQDLRHSRLRFRPKQYGFLHR